ncbi:MAG: tRNA (N(6)-L-threonylcarbamoyladenosine(37)-C(2))-methylthiotransferase [Thaumarchaeota archaeon]|nr:tRNA (N(6)-L-threonylcarbamoyladenosine(37)-C(2))-methylthiotransferase [Nitrososphaerota archaeon]
MLVMQAPTIVRYLRTLSQITGRKEEVVEGEQTVAELIAQLESKYSNGFENVKVLINGIPAEKEHSIQNGDVVALIPQNATPKVYVETYGCSASMADAEMTLGQLLNNGFKLSNNMADSDVNIIVTCSVKSATASHMLSRIRKLSNTGLPLVVAGCMPKTEAKAIEKINPNASLLGPSSIDKSVDVVNSAILGKRLVVLNDSPRPKISLPRFRMNPVIEILEIANGCLSSCTFCQVKIAKGRLRSYPTDAIVEEAKNSISQGCKEIWLTSTDNGCYGKDMMVSLHDLIDAIAEIDGEFWIRVGMMNPVHMTRMTRSLMESYSSAKVFKFLHIPVQSGSETILRAMKRGHSVEDFELLANEFRKSYPDSSLSTDIIVGYPNESESDFEETLSLIERVQPEIVNVSKFGTRPGTVAAKLRQLPTTIVSKRTKELVGLVKDVGKKRNERWRGWEGAIIIDEEGSKAGTWVGRNSAYRPVTIKSFDRLLGKKVNAKITGFTSSYLIGEIAGS